MLIRFHTIPACHGQTDRLTDRITISISRVSSRMLTRNKNGHIRSHLVKSTAHLDLANCAAHLAKYRGQMSS